jgi:hypothetical protein
MEHFSFVFCVFQMLNPDQDPNAGFATNPFENGDPRGDSGDRRFVDGPKVPMQELFSYVRHAKLNLLKEALDYLPNKPFDPSLVQVSSIVTCLSALSFLILMIAVQVCYGPWHCVP